MATLIRRGVRVGEALDTGAQNCVLFSDDGELVYRFPRYEPRRVGDVAERHRRARAIGMPAPRVVAAVAGGLGEAHVVLQRIPGTPLQELLPRLPLSARLTAAAGIAELLVRLRAVSPGDWPFPAADWTRLWSGLGRDAAAAARTGRAGVRPGDVELARRASATARSAPIGLVHGDLAWGNILFADDGCVAGILDWDFAVIGDPAVDVAAVLMHLPEEMVHEFHARHEWAAPDLARFDDYLATWDLQHRLWQDAEAVG